MTYICRIEQNRRRLIELGIPAAVAGLNSAVAQQKFVHTSCATNLGWKAALMYSVEGVINAFACSNMRQ